MAIIGNNPKTGKTCFFQNNETRQRRLARPPSRRRRAIAARSGRRSPQSYCSGNCHGRTPSSTRPGSTTRSAPTATPIVPKMGEHPDFLISDIESPYNVVNGPAQGFAVPQQLVSDEVAPAPPATASPARLRRVRRVVDGQGDRYFSKITASHNSAPRSVLDAAAPRRLHRRELRAVGDGRNAVKHILELHGRRARPVASSLRFRRPAARRPRRVERPTTGPIPEATLVRSTRTEIVAEQLNCREGAGTNTGIVTRLFEGDTVTAAPAASASVRRPTVASGSASRPTAPTRATSRLSTSTSTRADRRKPAVKDAAPRQRGRRVSRFSAGRICPKRAGMRHHSRRRDSRGRAPQMRRGDSALLALRFSAAFHELCLGSRDPRDRKSTVGNT